MTNFKKEFRKNPILRPVILTASYIKNVILLQLCFKVKVFYRTKLKDTPYKEIANYKDKYKGQRCFILATGPSLTEEDVSKLKGEITFGMNSLYIMLNKLGWNTTFYGVQDVCVYEKIQKDLRSNNNTTYFISDLIFNKYKCPSETIPFSLNLLNHRYSLDKLKADFSHDVLKNVYDGYSITYSLIQIAVYMGFEKIYLLGNDCNYSKDPKKRHFADYGYDDPEPDFSGQRILYAYSCAKEYQKGKSFEIVNCTRGGALELFRRMDLDDVLAGKDM